ncbi:hypothetical protein GCM10007859_08470 [Brevundimonas denitrificans]|uniref:DUF1697 domain-containing protein n=1 Tax=Brevundimonas denitrificans TaxID=1443434 RepID=A0ABQ6BFQ0_9CAUL|nr:DUF1697 domain-containing protein [Brevundimonas denitrificans]GLS00838.1 hypothetical protein GCM10007859_08470 [Brevundimonas denitrificans]
MTHRIILFRGMNTGGVRAPVSDLRAMAADMGLKNPCTLLASGNLVVESGKATDALEHDIEAAMEKTFGLKVAAMVRTPDQWASLVAANPFPDEAAAHPARVVAMVMKDGIRAGALDACRELAEGGECVEAIDDVLWFWFPNGQGESGIFKKATPRLLGMGTGRNWNTVLKLADMVGLTR